MRAVPIAATEGPVGGCAIQATLRPMLDSSAWPPASCPGAHYPALPVCSNTPSQVPAEESVLEAEHQHALLAAQRAFDDIAIVSLALLGDACKEICTAGMISTALVCFIQAHCGS